MGLPWKIDDNSISDRIWKDKSKMMREIEREIAIDINTGRSPQISAENISQKLGVAKSNAKRLILTEEARFGSIAQMNSYKEMGIERYEILATLDLRTSKICQDMDGMIFFVKDYDVGVNAPPFHPRCRTVTIPYFEDDIKSTRAARDIESDKTHYISSDMTYDTWRQKYVNMDKSKESGYNININLQLFANKDLPKQTIKQMEKGIKSYKKQIDIHNDKINNPQKYVENWDKLDKLNQDGLIRHWNKEIETFNKNIHDNIEELKKRGVEID